VSEHPVVVTGSASGIGHALAARLLAEGIEVIGLDLQATGPDGIDARACDLSDPVAIDTVVGALPDVLGGLACVAGIPGTHPPGRVLAVNLLAPRRLADELGPRIARGGAIVHVASVAAQRSDRPQADVDEVLNGQDAAAHDWLARTGLDGSATYDFTKKALLELTRRHARAGLARGVRAVSVSPGPTQTPILEEFAETMGQDRMDAAVQIVGRHGRPDDVAPLIAFLLGEQAGWINAVDVRVDGGLLGVR
jgi:NAD(P)-dependent dehydrogenase (short-subunit alcohol dehydrogenase family)